MILWFCDLTRLAENVQQNYLEKSFLHISHLVHLQNLSQKKFLKEDSDFKSPNQLFYSTPI